MTRAVLASAAALLLVAGVSLAAEDDPQAPHEPLATLVVIVHGLESNEGTVNWALWGSESAYRDWTGSVRGGTASIASGRSIFVLSDLPHGEYGISLYHDENENEKLDSNLFRIPKEPHGFSNDAKSTFGPPSWDDVKFELDQSRIEIEIRVH